MAPAQRGDRVADALLIVEPDPAIARLFALVLGEEGFATVCAASPAEALALLASTDPDTFWGVVSYAFADQVCAPYAWLDRLRTQTDAPIVICTRHPAARYADHQARGYAAVVEEPCDLQEVVDAVARLDRVRVKRPAEWGDAPPHDDAPAFTKGATP